MTDHHTDHPEGEPTPDNPADRVQLEEYLANSRDIPAPQNPSRAQAEELRAKSVVEEAPKVDPRNKLNDLTGTEWMPLTKSFTYQKGLGSKHPHAQIERQHPAPFSFQDISQLISFFTKEGMTVLDPFGGVGSTAKAAAVIGRKAISIELQRQWHDLAIERLEVEVAAGAASEHRFINQDSREALWDLEPECVDFVVTSPPYWSILNKRADHKVKKERLANDLATNYSDSDPKDLANVSDYAEFLDALVSDFMLPSARSLRTSKYLCMIVSDFRHKSEFVSFHSDLIQRLNGAEVPHGGKIILQGVKVLLQNHKSLLPYGYPFAYVENIHHQYILIFRKVTK